MNRVENRYAHIYRDSRSRIGFPVLSTKLLHLLHVARMQSGCGCGLLQIGAISCYTNCYRLGRRSVQSEVGTLETTAVGGRFTARLCGAWGMFMMIIHIIGTESERGSGLLPALVAGAAARDDGAVGGLVGRCEPPGEKEIGTAGGLLSDRGQLRLTIALEKTPVHVSESRPEAA